MKKVLALLLTLVLSLSLFAGCDGDGAESDAYGDATAVIVVGPDSGTKMEIWTFVELHNVFYAHMLERWNELNPDRQIQMTFVTYPYSEMHNKMTMALQTGVGAPDLCDIEISQFPNFLRGVVQLYPLNDALAPYIDDIVPARLDIYSKDGRFYGAPTHVGATVMYYNVEILEKYGIDYTTIVTWDDFTAAAHQLKEASNGEVFMTSVDTGGSDWMWVAMASKGEDWTGGSEAGPANVQLDSVYRMLSMQKQWLEDGVAMISPGGQVDTEQGWANIIDGNIAGFPKAMWFMSRFLNYMPEMAGKIAIAPVPVFEVGDLRSVGIGGTGTVVSLQSSDPTLAADYISFAKGSYEGNLAIWDILGFDTVNTSVWSDPDITTDETNQFIAYFVTNPFDTLNEIKDEIGKIAVVSFSPTINETINITTLNAIFEGGMGVAEALAEAQRMIEIELH
ncbi:MAG: extracellular solute-binding protein [Defluviitaleaceae bacterium]|nr:extracellular solute-binding protein [Defluviitaleaceae bacterium]MCL2836875.1 extracellular solute-binding protein [Defluviitaleaceae bacterium]